MDVKSTLQAIACANGASSLDAWVSNFHRFERIQIALWGTKQGQASQDALKEAEERERALSERELQTRQVLAQLEHECDQVKKERDHAQRGVSDLQSALDERSRQADNWRAMYEALKTGGRVTIPSSQPQQQSSSSKLLVPSNTGNGRLPSNGGAGPDLGGGGGMGLNRMRTGSMMSVDSIGSDQSFRSSSNASFPIRSNTLPIHNNTTVRPQTREALDALLSRSIAPSAQRNSLPTYRPTSGIGLGNGSMMSRQGQGGGGPLPLQDPIRSTFFAPASLRAMSPSMHQQQQQQMQPQFHTRSMGQGGGMPY